MEIFVSLIAEKYFTWVRDILDVAIVSYFIYRALILIQGTRAVQLIRGLLLLFFTYILVNNILQLRTMTWIMQNGTTFVLFSLPIIFQPELRRMLALLGKDSLVGENNFFKGKDLFNYVNVITTAAKNLSNKKIGALIIIERQTGLNEFIESGMTIDAELSSEILETIFYTGTPLHDGAVIIRNNRLVSASVLLPLSENIKPIRGRHHLGTRHRAGLGLSETSDAFCIIVSEETGDITVALHSKLHRHLTEEALEKMLLDSIQTKEKEPRQSIKENLKNIGNKVKTKALNAETIIKKTEAPKKTSQTFLLKGTSFLIAFLVMVFLSKNTLYTISEKTYMLPLHIKYSENVQKSKKKFQVTPNYIKLRVSGDKSNLDNLKTDELNVFVSIDKIDNNKKVSVNVSVPTDVTIKEVYPRDVLINCIDKGE